MQGCRGQLAAVVTIVAAIAIASLCGPLAPNARSESSPTANPLGITTGPGVDADIVGNVSDLGAGWVRMNDHLDGDASDRYKALLDAGINLVITISNRDSANSDTRYGNPKHWSNAGFPFLSKVAYEGRVRSVLTPLIPYIATGRQVWIQAENEISDVTANPTAAYWRGTTDQYLAQLAALYEAAKSVEPSIPVILTSFASQSLDAALDPSNQNHAYQSKWLAQLLAEGQYDVADLHFYGCEEDVPAKVQWVRDHMPAGKLWISTENGGPDSRCPSTPISWNEDEAGFEALQADQVPARLSSCLNSGGSICMWTTLYDHVREAEVFKHLGLVDPMIDQGSPQPSVPSISNPRKKPAYYAFKDFVSAYLHQTPSGPDGVPLQSPAQTVQPAAPAMPESSDQGWSRVRILSRSAMLGRGGKTMLRLRCRAVKVERCLGRLSLKIAGPTKAHGKLGRKAVARRSFAIAGGSSAAVKLQLSRVAQRQVVKRLKTLQVKAVATANGQTSTLVRSQRLVAVKALR